MKIWDALRVRLFGVPTPKGDMPRTIGGWAQNAGENRSQIRGGNEGGAELQTPDRLGTAGDEEAFEDDISTRAHPKKNVETVLFICSGNICRSAYGAARLLKMAQDSGRAIRVSSCGTLRIIGRGAAVGMIKRSVFGEHILKDSTRASWTAELPKHSKHPHEDIGGNDEF